MKKKVVSEPVSKTRKAITPEAREQQLISMAINLAEQQLKDGTASSQVITHFLKLGTMEKKLELKKLETDIKLQEAKTTSLERSERMEEMYLNAITAMKQYTGQEVDDS